ncbi:3-ketoacyl-ACP reductase [Microvirga aerophila]|uniref:3-ketoacyl-ACP reductase n=1 Tax=Microvirga aerophila TaxID=670291 RepID=A0A512BLN8_9HYPH|nr:3-ketoacyl-ACP reductase [Microvirga aerophila]GEO12881.1 3-ketoacyl-ACP reductase [Microvirga aerophila]
MNTRPVALVTGSRRGIGLAIARKLATDGFDLFITGTDPDSAEETLADLRQYGARAFYLSGDISDLQVHDRWVNQIQRDTGRIDCLVNNAGMGAVVRGDFLELLPDNFDRVISVNLRGTMFLTQAVLKVMLQQPRDGRPKSIINVTSVSASHASPDRLDYCVSKAGLAMWSQGLALRLAGEGIGVFDVRPGIIRTDMTAGVTEKYGRLIANGLVPAGRWGEGDDVANVVTSLASGAFAFATGSVIDVDGGLSIGRL